MSFELCPKCQKNVEKELNELGLTSATVEELIEEEALINFSLAVDLAKEGHLVKRVNDKFPFTVKEVDPTGCGEKKLEFCVVNEELEIISYKTFSNEDILADDYIVVK